MRGPVGHLASHWLAPSAVVSYVGVDASPTMLGRARVAEVREFENACFELADVTDIGYPDAADVALFFNAPHCVPNPPSAVAEVTRCLKPGGRPIGSMLITGSAKAERLLARERTRPNRAGGPGGTFADLDGWLHAAGLTDVDTAHEGAMAVFEAAGPAAPTPNTG